MMADTTVITTLATTLSGSAGQTMQDRIYEFHRQMALDFSGINTVLVKEPPPVIPPTPPANPPWWYGRSTPFLAKAKAPCRVWRQIGDAQPLRTLTDQRLLDVKEVWMPGGKYPAWFLVWRDAQGDQWVLADETEPA